MIRLTKKILKKIVSEQAIQKAKKLKHSLKLKYSNTLWLSLGENCLTDNILTRHKLKSFSTPYSHGRSNIDYANHLEEIDYNNFLDDGNLGYGYVEELKVVRSTLVNKSDLIYNRLHMSGFEFTHHDVKGSPKEKESLKRKIDRLKQYKGRKNFIFLYHYRENSNMVPERVFEKAKRFTAFYSVKKKKCNIVIFTQKISETERGVYYRNPSPNVHFFELVTKQRWVGAEPRIFWAKVDDDLIGKMLTTANSIIRKKLKVKEGYLQ